MKNLTLHLQQKTGRYITYFDDQVVTGTSTSLSKEAFKALAEETKRLLEIESHQNELIQNHGNDGHRVVQVLHHVETHGHKVKSQASVPHVVFSLSPEQFKILQASKRWKMLKSIFEITHDIIESEVEQVIKFQFSKTN